MKNEKVFLFKNLNEKLEIYKNHATWQFEQTQTRFNYLDMSSISLIDHFLSLFKDLFDKHDFSPISDFLYFLKANQFLAESFQIAICYAKYDL